MQSYINVLRFLGLQSLRRYSIQHIVLSRTHATSGRVHDNHDLPKPMSDQKSLFSVHGCHTLSAALNIRGGCMNSFWLASGAMVDGFPPQEILPRFTQKAWNTRSSLVLSGLECRGSGRSHG